MFDSFDYGYLGLGLAADGHTLYYLTGSPLSTSKRRPEAPAKDEEKAPTSSPTILRLQSMSITDKSCSTTVTPQPPRKASPSHLTAPSTPCAMSDGMENAASNSSASTHKHTLSHKRQSQQMHRQRLTRTWAIIVIFTPPAPLTSLFAIVTSFNICKYFVTNGLELNTSPSLSYGINREAPVGGRGFLCFNLYIQYSGLKLTTTPAFMGIGFIVLGGFGG